MIKFNNIALEAIDRDEQYYLNEYGIADDLVSSQLHLEQALSDTFMKDSWQTDYPFHALREFSAYELDIIIDYLIDNQADLLEIGYGYHVVTGYFALAMISEVQVDLSDYHWTDYRESIVSRYTDMVVHNGYGFVSCNAHLDIRLDVDAITDALLEQIGY